MKIKRVYITEITNMLLDNNYYELEKLTYDYDSKKIMYDGEAFIPKIESWKFGLHFFVEANYKHFQDAVYCLAVMNTPKPVKELHPLCEPIEQWLNKHNKKEVTSIEIITDCLGGKLLDLNQRQLEIRVGKCLRELGWTKVKKEKYNMWIKN